MESISLRLRLPLLPQRPSSLIFRRRKTCRLDNARKEQPMMKTVLFAAKRDAYDRDDYGGRRVDENMIVLRMRIHDINMAERNHEPPSDWMEWEKRYYPDYESDIYEAMGLLQTLLMNSRPSLVFGLVAVVAFSVLIAVVMSAHHLMEILNKFICGPDLNNWHDSNPLK